MTEPQNGPDSQPGDPRESSCPTCCVTGKRFIVWIGLLAALGLLAVGLVYYGAHRAESNIDTTALPLPDVDAPYISTPQDVVDAMLDLAEVTSDDVVYDLGCGDGRIVVTAARRFGCRGVGFDNNPERIKECLENARTNQVEDLVEFHEKDIFTLDLSEASVVTLYLLPRLNVKLIPQLDKLEPGSRIISHDWGMKGVPADKSIDIESLGENGREHTLHLWVAPLEREPAQAGPEEGP